MNHHYANCHAQSTQHTLCFTCPSAATAQYLNRMFVLLNLRRWNIVWHLISQNQSSNSNSYWYRIKFDSCYGLLTVNEWNTLRSYFAEQRLNHNDKNKILSSTTSNELNILFAAPKFTNSQENKWHDRKKVCRLILVVFKFATNTHFCVIVKHKLEILGNVFIFVYIARKNNNVFIRIRSFPSL